MTYQSPFKPRGHEGEHHGLRNVEPTTYVIALVELRGGEQVVRSWTVFEEDYRAIERGFSVPPHSELLAPLEASAAGLDELLRAPGTVYVRDDDDDEPPA